MIESAQVHTISCGCDYGDRDSTSVEIVCAFEDDTDEGIRILSVRESAPPPYQCKMHTGRRFYPNKAQRWRKG